METVPAITFLATIEGLRILGFEVDELLEEAGVATHLTNDSPAQPYAIYEKLWAAASLRTPRAELAIELGLCLPHGVFGAIDYLTATADTIGGACQALVAHFGNLYGGGLIEVERTADACRVAYIPQRHTSHDHIAVDCAIAILVNRLRSLPVELPITSVELTRCSPAHPERFVALLGAPVAFERAIGTIHLLPHALDIPLRTRNPMLRRTLESMTALISRGEGGTSLERAIRSHLRDLLPTGCASALRVARALGMSERTLRRRLSEGGRSYQEVVDTFRREEAERLLSARQMDMAEVAQVLGFADQSAFTRAFRRWTNTTPSVWAARQSR